MRSVRIAALTLFFALPSLAQPVDTRAVDRIVESTLAAWHIPGAAVAIVDNDKVVYLHGYGIEEVGKPARVTPDTLFSIASDSKAFTTAAMAMMVDEKKMSWDDPVRKYLDYFHLSDPCADSQVTLRDIVSHRTGLSRHDELWDNTALTREQVIRAMAWVDLSKPIRTTFQYNNIMFITAGEAVAAAAKTPWDDFVRTRIFEPLGMKSTRTSVADFLAADHATGHRWDAHTKSVSIQPLVDDANIGAAGNVKSSARDMAQWLRFQLAGGVIDGRRLVSTDALDETKAPQIVIRRDEADKDSNPETNVHSYAMGWNVQDYRGELLVSHGGALNGFRSQVGLLPSRNRGFVVMINAGRGFATVAMRNALADLLLDKTATDWNAYYLTIDQRFDARDEAARKEREAKRRPDARPSRELAAYAGRYTNPAYGTAVVALENGSLVFRWQRLSLPLVPYGFDTFTATSEADDIDEMATFRLDAAGDVKWLSMFGVEFEKE